jgi:GNAT superfamily N-acetyltransferase
VVKKSVPGLTLRMATADDAELLNEMISAFAAYERLPNASNVDSLRRELTSADRVFEAVIAFLDGKAVGFAVFFHTYSTFIAKRGLYLEDIYVREEYRNKGVATALLKHIAKVATERGLGRVEFTVLLWNTVAIEFFETLGATPNSAWTTYRLSGEWLQKLAADVTDSALCAHEALAPSPLLTGVRYFASEFGPAVAAPSATPTSGRS